MISAIQLGVSSIHTNSGPKSWAIHAKLWAALFPSRWTCTKDQLLNSLADIFASSIIVPSREKFLMGLGVLWQFGVNHLLWSHWNSFQLQVSYLLWMSKLRLSPPSWTSLTTSDRAAKTKPLLSLKSTPIPPCVDSLNRAASIFALYQLMGGAHQ